MIINPQFIGSRQTHRKRRLHRIDLHEDHGELCIEDPRERRSHLATSYGPEGLWWTTHASSERQWCWWRSPPYPNPPSGRAPERAPDGILRRQKLAAAEKYFRWSPDFFWNLWDYIGERSRSGDLQGAHKPGWRALWSLVVCFWDPWGSSGLAPKFSDLLPFQKKSFRGFSSVWTPFQDLLWKGSKTWKKQELVLGTEVVS